MPGFCERNESEYAGRTNPDAYLNRERIVKNVDRSNVLWKYEYNLTDLREANFSHIAQENSPTRYGSSIGLGSFGTSTELEVIKLQRNQ